MDKLAFSALCLFMFSVPIEDTVTIPGVGSSARVFGYIAIIFGALSLLMRGHLRKPDRVHILWLYFVLLAICSIAWTYDSAGTQRTGFLYAEFLIMMMLLWEIAPSNENQTTLIAWFTFGAAVGLLWTIFSYLSGNAAYQNSSEMRFAAGATNPNDLAITFALSIPLSWYMAEKSTSTHGRIAFRMLLPVLTFGILLTGSRTGTLALLASMLIIPALGHRKTLVPISMTVIGAVMVALALVPDATLGRVFTLRDELLTGTMSQRTVIWGEGWRMFHQNPILGVGSGAFARAVWSMKNDPGITVYRGGNFGLSAAVAHNAFLEILVELGVIGFLYFMFCLAATSSRVLRMPSTEKRLWSIMLLIWCIGASAGSLEFDKITWVLFGMTLAQAGSNRNLRSGMAEAETVRYPDLLQASHAPQESLLDSSL